MNLTRNHIIYYKWRIEALCIIQGLALPGEYYIPTPPEVSNYYMANLDNKARAQRLESMGKTLVTEKPVYDDAQMSFV